MYHSGINWGTKGLWRDLHLRIEGQGVYELQKQFLLDWYYSHKESLIGQEFFPEIQEKGTSLLQVVNTSPFDPYESITSGFFQAINLARKNITIQTPYFAPVIQIMRAIQTASLSGVEVRLMIPKQSDNRLIDAGTITYLQPLLETNVKIYLYNAGFIHSKMFVIDDYLTIIGTANMDFRSFELNFESSVFIYDTKIARVGLDIFELDLLDSELLDKEIWAKRPKWKKLIDSFVRLFSPLF